MLKKISPYAMFCIALALCAATHAADGDFVWAKAMGGTGYDFGYSVAVDLLGNIYTTGEFGDTVDFDPGTGTALFTSVSGDDIFISKLDASGNFVWAKTMGGTGDDRGYSIAVDSAGNAYTTGFFSGTVDFDPGAGTALLTSAGAFDIFVLKLDNTGNFVWAKAMGGASYINASSITVDSLGNLYITGWFRGTADFDPGAGTALLNAPGDNNIFVSELDNAGNFIWAKAMGGGGR